MQAPSNNNKATIGCIDVNHGRSILCLGTAQFGMDYGVQRGGQPGIDAALSILDAAVNNGVCAIDTAAAYGTAEEVVGTFLNSHKGVREQIELISKLSPAALNSVSPKQYFTVIYDALQKSLSKLRTDYLDGYLLHNPESVLNKAIVDALMTLKSKGIVKRVGASVYNPGEAEEGISVGLDVLQIPYSLFDQRMEEQGVMELARQRGVMLHARSVFTQGLMLMNVASIPRYLEKAQPVVKMLDDYCNAHNISRLQLAISFVCRQESISRIVFGVDNKQQLMEIIGASRQAIPDVVINDAKDRFAKLDEEIILPTNWKKDT